MITIWHNPRCSKSRQALAIVEGSGMAFSVRKYLEDAPSIAEIEMALTALDLKPIDIMRKGEARFRELGLAKDSDDQTLLTAMSENPILIERPIVFQDDHALIGRPPEKVASFLAG